MKLSKAVSLNHLYNVTGEIHGNTGMDYRSGFVIMWLHCSIRIFGVQKDSKSSCFVGVAVKLELCSCTVEKVQDGNQSLNALHANMID